MVFILRIYVDKLNVECNVECTIQISETSDVRIWGIATQRNKKKTKKLLNMIGPNFLYSNSYHFLHYYYYCYCYCYCYYYCQSGFLTAFLFLIGRRSCRVNYFSTLQSKILSVWLWISKIIRKQCARFHFIYLISYIDKMGQRKILYKK